MLTAYPCHSLSRKAVNIEKTLLHVAHFSEKVTARIRTFSVISFISKIDGFIPSCEVIAIGSDRAKKFMLREDALVTRVVARISGYPPAQGLPMGARGDPRVPLLTPVLQRLADGPAVVTRTASGSLASDTGRERPTRGE